MVLHWWRHARVRPDAAVARAADATARAMPSSSSSPPADDESVVRMRSNSSARDALTAVWRARAEGLTRDLERARALFSAMKDELTDARLANEDKNARLLALEKDNVELVRGAQSLEQELRRTRGEVKELEMDLNAERDQRERAQVELRTMDERRRLAEEGLEVNAARERERVETTRARAEQAERRAGKAEKAARAARDDAERKQRELEQELERERSVRARLEQERMDLEVDRRRFHEFDSMLAQERVKVVEAHSSAKLATDALREQLHKSEDDVAQLRRTLESRSVEMANAVRALNEELAVQHDVVERGMSARVDALRDAFEDELQRVRVKAQTAIDEAKAHAKAQEERISKLEQNLGRAEHVSREALTRLKAVTKASSSLERERDTLQHKLHALGELNSKLTRRIIDGAPFVHDDELNNTAREVGEEIDVNTPSPARPRSSKSRRVASSPPDLHDIARIQEELEQELAELRMNHEAISREVRDSSVDDGEMLIRALEDASARMSQKSRQIKVLNTTLRTSNQM
jgi:chromosome segregation ATPase